MPVCRTCGGEFNWALVDGKWELLEPVATHGDLDRSFVDENGELRANHRDRHGSPAINAVRLERRVRAEDVEQEAPLHRRAAEAAKLVRGRG